MKDESNMAQKPPQLKLFRYFIAIRNLTLTDSKAEQIVKKPVSY